MNKLQELTRTRGLTTLLTLHHLELVAHYADQVVAVHDKTIYACGKPCKVMTQEMFRDVFRIDTEVFTDKRGTIRVLPIAPVAAAAPAAVFAPNLPDAVNTPDENAANCDMPEPIAALAD